MNWLVTRMQKLDWILSRDVDGKTASIVPCMPHSLQCNHIHLYWRKGLPFSCFPPIYGSISFTSSLYLQSVESSHKLGLIQLKWMEQPRRECIKSIDEIHENSNTVYLYLLDATKLDVLISAK